MRPETREFETPLALALEQAKPGNVVTIPDRPQDQVCPGMMLAHPVTARTYQAMLGTTQGTTLPLCPCPWNVF